MAKRPNPELVAYIEKHLAKGFKITHVKRKLAEVGHPIEAIEDAAQFVLAKQPKKKVPRFMIVYGLILILVLAGFGWYIWFKATQQVEYTETVKEIQQNQSYIGRTEVELIKLARSTGDMKACDFIKSHNLRYACTGKYWERDDCTYERILGDGYDDCLMKLAVNKNDINVCYQSGSVSVCRERFGAAAFEAKDSGLCKGSFECVAKYAELSGSTDPCESLLGLDREACLSRFSSLAGDPSACDKINSAYRLVCQRESGAFFADALPKICGDGVGFENNPLRLYCAAYDAILKGDLGLCFSNKYYDEYLKSGVVSLKELQSVCVTVYGIHKDDRSVCSSVPVSDFRKVCEATTKTPGASCDLVESPPLRVLCSAWYDEDKEICSDIVPTGENFRISNACLGFFDLEFVKV
ncbi:hypothetical protein KY359_04885 [Candidatus Woesearchaeota archaeon]|nr:hypothetical protein [Candidatus Woesearchaeota archaeon]